MRAVFGLVLLIGMGLAGFAVYMVKGYFDTQERRLAIARQQAAQIIKTVDIYAPNRAIDYGELVTIDDVTVIKYAEDFLPDGVFLTEEDLFPRGPDVPRVAVLPMQVNEPILASKVTEAGASRGLTALVAPGMRAFPISGTSQFGVLRPNDRVDLYWTGRLRSGREVTNLLKPGLEIIAILGDNGRGRGSNNVIVQVTPEEVALLTQAQNSGRLTLSLVGSGDANIQSPIQVDIQQVTGEGDVVVEEEEEVVEEERCFVIERSGTQRVEVEIECAN